MSVTLRLVLLALAASLTLAQTYAQEETFRRQDCARRHATDQGAAGNAFMGGVARG
ncbi:MAG: hypothetical protein ABIQ03_12555 [Burkholderiales bacterium]